MKDLIDRQAAIDAVNSYFGFNIEEEYGSAVQEVINNLPAAQPERKTEEIDKDINVPSTDCISRKAAIDLVRDVCDAIMSCCGSHYDEETKDEVYDDIREVDAILKCNKEIRIALKNMPAAQPDLPEAYAKKVWEWLLDYQTTAAELKAKYSAYEVLSWVANDWRRGHGGLN